MKKIIFTSIAVLGIFISLAKANDVQFLQTVSSKLFAQNKLSVSEQIKLLKLSPEAPQSSNEINKSNSRRNFSYLKLRKPKPFYKKRLNRVVDEPSIFIVKRKDRFAREKALRYRKFFTAYGR